MTAQCSTDCLYHVANNTQDTVREGVHIGETRPPTILYPIQYDKVREAVMKIHAECYVCAESNVHTFRGWLPEQVPPVFVQECVLWRVRCRDRGPETCPVAVLFPRCHERGEGQT